MLIRADGVVKRMIRAPETSEVYCSPVIAHIPLYCATALLNVSFARMESESLSDFSLSHGGSKFGARCYKIVKKLLKSCASKAFPGCSCDNFVCMSIRARVKL